MISNSIIPAASGEALLHPVDRAGGILGVSRSMVYRMIRDGRLRTVRIDTKTLIPQRSIAELLEKIGA